MSAPSPLPSAPPQSEGQAPKKEVKEKDLKELELSQHARPPAVNTGPLLIADGLTGSIGHSQPSSVVRPVDLRAALANPSPDQKTPGITKIPDNEDLYVALERLGLMYSMDHGTSCCGKVIDEGQLGVIENRGRIQCVKSGQWKLWGIHETWSNPPIVALNSAVILLKGVYIIKLNQKEVMVGQDANGKTLLLSNGRYIIQSPAMALGNIVSLVELIRYQQIGRFSFFNVPQGEVAGVTLTSGEIKILLPGVHIVEDCKFERFLTTVPIQSKLKKDVVTSDLVIVSLEVDIATQLVDVATFLRMSSNEKAHAAPVAPDQQGKKGCKDLFDAIEETAESHFIDVFGKTQYYNMRTRQGEEESRFEEAALRILDGEARKYGGTVLKVNILKQRADAVERVYAEHNATQVQLEQKKQSQVRKYDIDNAEQKHQQEMAEREERGLLTKQQLTQERDLAAKLHVVKLQVQESRAQQERLDMETKATMSREKLRAEMESEASKVRAMGLTQQQAQNVLELAQANARAKELEGVTAAKILELRANVELKSEQMKSETRISAAHKLAEVYQHCPGMVELEKSRVHEEFAVQKLQAIVASGARAIPVEFMRLMDVADERVLKRLETQTVLHAMGGASVSMGLPVGALPGSVLPRS
jgi:hypothetical protein